MIYLPRAGLEDTASKGQQRAYTFNGRARGAVTRVEEPPSHAGHSIPLSVHLSPCPCPCPCPTNTSCKQSSLRAGCKKAGSVEPKSFSCRLHAAASAQLDSLPCVASLLVQQSVHFLLLF